MAWWESESTRQLRLLRSELERLADLVEANTHDPAALAAVITAIREEKTKLEAAVSANTPAQ